MWQNMRLITDFFLSIMGQTFALYTTGGILSAVLVIWLVRRVLKTFNLI